MSWTRPSRRVARQTGKATADYGGIAITGVVNAPVTVGFLPVARSAYLQQVQRICPPQLFDREDELAEIAEFCTAPDQTAYLWLRGTAWSGKSALLSWFVLHPPAGVRIASFFITARYAGQSDRAAFIDVVIEQLAELLNEPIPPLFADPSREGHLLDLLARAADICQRRDERLILLVDGLDEDLGVTTGPDAHSIAALLPIRPAAGLRVIVAGRPNPPIPADVPDDHPLHRGVIIKDLTVSRHAQVVRQDSQRELKRLLLGSRSEKDVLGLLTAANGGLTGRDLAELTSRSTWEIEDHLAAVSGRTFTARTGRWRPDTKVYVLGHEELQRSSVCFFSDGIETYRQRLHRWAENYRDRRWPRDTPE